MVNKTNVERSVVNDKLSAFYVIKELLGYFPKPWFISYKLIGDAVNVDNFLIHKSIWIQIHMEVIAGQAAVIHFHTTDLNDPMTI